jgi:glycosyltransferase involved in cell wall biosynthesis
VTDQNEVPPLQPLLTVVIPHFNQKEFLLRAVASILNSGIAESEIIVSDDGSTDGSEPVLASLEALDQRITVIRSNTNRGAVVALNTGLAAARGRYVSFLGADDFVLPTLYAPLLRALEENPGAGFACSEIAIVGDDGSLRGIRPMTPPAFRTEYLDPQTVCRRIENTDNWICSTSTVYRTDRLRAAGGFDETLGFLCDTVINRLLAFAHGFVFVPGVRAVFRVAAGTLSGSAILDQDKSMRLLQIARERLSDSIVGQISPGYPDTFNNRIKFYAARMQFVWKGRDADPNVIVAAASGTNVDLKVLTAVRRFIGFGVVGRTLAIGWLTLRMRPAAPLSLIVPALRNRFAMIRNRRYVTDLVARMDEVSKEMLNAATPGSSRSAK